MADWDPSLYLKFSAERTRPAVELAAAVPLERAARALDIGCGPGNSTAVLAARFPGAQVTGVDSSPAMVDEARAAHPALRFAVCDVCAQLETLGGGWDVVFSNACLQWVPGHRDLLPALYGLLAVQMPLQSAQPVHALLRQLAQSPRWRDKIPAARPFHMLSPEEYFTLLGRLTPNCRLWETVYYQPMDSHEALLDWYRATGLRPYLAPLSPADAAAFEADVLAGLRALYPLAADGRILFRFPRLFFTAARP